MSPKDDSMFHDKGEDGSFIKLTKISPKKLKLKPRQRTAERPGNEEKSSKLQMYETAEFSGLSKKMDRV